MYLFRSEKSKECCGKISNKAAVKEFYIKKLKLMEVGP